METRTKPLWMILGEQVRAARGLLGWSQQELADAAEVGLSTVKTFESGKRKPIRANMTAIQNALETAGVVFNLDEGTGQGVRFFK
jgi:transcriptional regulator with XRE-family HTH domain